MAEEAKEITETPAEQTQGQKPEAIPYDRFRDVNEKYKAAEAELAKMREADKQRGERELAEQNKWKELAEQREKELNDERIRNNKLAVGTAKGLPIEIVDRLRGNTIEELEQDADSMLALFAKKEQAQKQSVFSKQDKNNDKPQFLGTPEDVRKLTAELVKGFKK